MKYLSRPSIETNSSQNQKRTLIGKKPIDLKVSTIFETPRNNKFVTIPESYITKSQANSKKLFSLKQIPRNNQCILNLQPEKRYPFLNENKSCQQIKYIKLDRQKPSTGQIIQRKINSRRIFYNKSQDLNYREVEVGVPAIEKYYQHFKTIGRVSELNSVHSQKGFQVFFILNFIKDSALTKMFRIHQQNFMLPKRMGLVKYQGSSEKLELSNTGYGKYYNKISKVIKNMNDLEQIELQNNSITDKSAEELIKNMNFRIKKLDLAGNKLGKQSCELIGTQLSTFNSKLLELNLEKNNLGDQSIDIIVSSLIENMTLRVLNLSANLLTDNITFKLNKLLVENNQLKELYLHWNRITGKGASIIFAALEDNQSLKVFDISENSLGGSSRLKTNQILLALEKFFSKNSSIIHLDLSWNRFTLQESKEIADYLKENKSIVGFHFDGNFGVVDCFGFLQVDQCEKDLSVFPIRIKSVDPQKNLYKKKVALGNRNVCWICDGWQQKEIKWVPQRVQQQKSQPPVFVHMNFNKYNSYYLGKGDKIRKVYAQQRMLPPSEIEFFYSVNTQPNAKKNNNLKCVQSTGLHYKEKLLPVNEQKKVIALCGENIQCQIEKVNVIHGNENFDHLFGNNYEQFFTSCIRSLPKFQTKEQKPLNKWVFPISLMYDWKPAHEDLLKNCFETDWNNSKIPRIIKDEDDLLSVKGVLRSVYQTILHGYKYYASQNPIGEVWCLQQLVFNSMIQECQILDDKIQMADIDIKFVAVTSQAAANKGNWRNPERGIVRHEFLESIVRIAQEKYIKYKVCKTFTDAVTNLLYAHCIPVFTKLDPQVWRNEKYWVEECDLVLKQFKPVLESIYEYYASHNPKIKPGMKKALSLDSLLLICKAAHLFDEGMFGEKDLQQCFNLSMMTQIDELNSDRIFFMNFVEFLECCARIADKYSALPFNLDSSEVTLNFQLFEQILKEYLWTQTKRQEQPLQVKIESLMMLFLTNVAEFQVQQTFSRPKESMFAFKEIEVEDSSSDEEIFTPITPCIQYEKQYN